LPWLGNVALVTGRAKSKLYARKRCDDASHSKALRAKCMESLVCFRGSFGSAYASSRRFNVAIGHDMMPIFPDLTELI
jgi:hypothetical protein